MFLNKVPSLKLIKFSVITTAVLIIIQNILYMTGVMGSDSLIFPILSLIMIIIFDIIAVQRINQYIVQMTKLRDTVQKVAKGDLYHRVVGIEERDIIGQVSWDVNDMLDQIETFNRDVETSLTMASAGQAHRRILTKGLHGDFVTVGEDVNKAIDSVVKSTSRDQFVCKQVLPVVTSYQNSDYTSSIEKSEIPEEMGDLGNGINLLGTALSDMMVNNHKNAISLQENSHILSTSMDRLLDGSNEQANDLEQANEMTRDLVSKVDDTYNQSQDMLKTAKTTKEKSELGNSLAQSTTESMEEISKSTESMGTSVEAIEQISFQTNILSLNAAVEAATAGEAGKGFAVVAGEVRNLASKSAESAEEIKKLVEEANVKTQEGKTNSIKMISNFKELTSNIETTTNLVENSAGLIEEQKKSINEINHFIENVAKMTDTNRQIAYDTSGISNRLKELSSHILDETATKNYIGKS
jgi:methyl-accepting chemotaxis protein